MTWSLERQKLACNTVLLQVLHGQNLVTSTANKSGTIKSELNIQAFLNQILKLQPLDLSLEL